MRNRTFPCSVPAFVNMLDLLFRLSFCLSSQTVLNSSLDNTSDEAKIMTAIQVLYQFEAFIKDTLLLRRLNDALFLISTVGNVGVMEENHRRIKRSTETIKCDLGERGKATQKF